MKKIIALVGLGLVAISIAHAENRLFPTDILGRGELDAQLLVGHDTYSGNIDLMGNPGGMAQNHTTQSLEVRYGLGANWHVGAAMHNVSRGVYHSDYTNPPTHFVDTDSEGRQNPSLWAVYGFVNDKANPFSLNGELWVSPNTTGRPGRYFGRLATGWKSSETLRLYGSLTRTASNDSRVADSIGIGGGAYYVISPSVTLIPSLSYTRNDATGSFSSMTQYSASLSSNIEIYRNTYMMPRFSHIWGSAGDSGDGLFHQGTTKGTAIGLGLYHLF